METVDQTPCHLPVVELVDVSFTYQEAKVIDRLNFTVQQRDFVGLLGSNGAGKSTLLKLIVGLLKPDQGEVRLFGEPIAKFKAWDKIGYVPQKHALNPLFPATVREVVLSGLTGRKRMFKRLTRQEQNLAEEAMEAMQIRDLADKRIGQLSGGQQQRVFLARAIIARPELLVLDEPTTGIDAETQQTFFTLLNHLHEKHTIAIVMVSHDLDHMRQVLGPEPVFQAGKLQFYVKHSHAPQTCSQTNVLHSVQPHDSAASPVVGAF